jgi:hypothetical protein
MSCATKAPCAIPPVATPAITSVFVNSFFIKTPPFLALIGCEENNI